MLSKKTFILAIASSMMLLASCNKDYSFKLKRSELDHEYQGQKEYGLCDASDISKEYNYVPFNCEKCKIGKFSIKAEDICLKNSNGETYNCRKILTNGSYTPGETKYVYLHSYDVYETEESETTNSPIAAAFSSDVGNDYKGCSLYYKNTELKLNKSVGFKE